MAADAAQTPPVPAASPWVVRWLPGVAAGGTVLDVACGSGRHLIAALQRGHTVIGVDRDIARARTIAHRDLTLIERDLEDGRPNPLPPGRFAAAIVANYLWRPILADIVAAVAPDGLLIYETFAQGHERFGRPSNPEFLLRPGELLKAAQPSLTTIAYEHGLLRNPDRLVQRIVACGPDHDWLNDPPPLESDSLRT